MEKLWLQYDEDLFIQSYLYMDKFEQFHFEIDDIQKLSNKESEMISKIENIYHHIKLFRDYSVVALGELSQEDTLAYVNYLLIELFPSQKDQIVDMNSLLTFEPVSYGESCLYYNMVDKKIVMDHICIPDQANGYIASIIGHEKTHVLTFQNLNLQSLYSQGLELLPTFIQKIILLELEEQFGFEYLQITDQIVRINDVKQAIDILKNTKAVIIENEMDRYVRDCQRIKSVDYIKAELFSKILLKNYKEDKITMTEMLNKLFHQKISLEHFYDFYHLSFTNKEIPTLVKQEINKVKRYKIIA